ncbi:MAG: hypothetical protein J2P17_08405 [Mycobacterium sp.]|nr:hypothetical protein [Mycobacterium sp.]
MPLPNPDQPIELSQLTTVSSVVDVVAGYVDDLAPIPAGELTDWLAGLAVPAGWQVLPLDASSAPLARLAVRGQRPEGGWDACDTISVFRFTGFPPREVVEDNAECTLRDLGAGESIHTTVAPPPPPGVAAVRSSGYFNLAGRPTYASYQTYVAGSDQPGQGRLIQHCMFIDADCFFQLGTDTGQLTRAVHGAFRTAIGADPKDAKWVLPDAVLANHPSAAILSREPGNDGIDMVAIALTPEEQRFIYSALIQWSSVATGSPLPIKALGIAEDWPQFDELVDRLRAAIAGKEPLSDLDWARALFLTEVSWASNLVAAGLDFALVTSIPDEEAIKLLRSIQRKIGGYYRANLLFPNAGRPRRTSTDEAPKSAPS